MTNDELQEIRARCEAATPGPWEKGDEVSKENALFIAHARSDIPALLGHIENITEEFAIIGFINLALAFEDGETDEDDEREYPLTWTNEPPKEPGHYWCRYTGSDKATWSPAYIPAVDGLHSYDMDQHDNVEWAGPIPMPKEPTE